MNKKERKQLELMKQYNLTKFRELQRTLDLLIQFARDDLKRLDKLEGVSKNKIKKEKKNG